MVAGTVNPAPGIILAPTTLFFGSGVFTFFDDLEVDVDGKTNLAFSGGRNDWPVLVFISAFLTGESFGGDW